MNLMCMKTFDVFDIVFESINKNFCLLGIYYGTDCIVPSFHVVSHFWAYEKLLYYINFIHKSLEEVQGFMSQPYQI